MRHEFEVELKAAYPKPRAGPPPTRAITPVIQRALVLAHQIADYITANGISTFAAFSACAGISAPRATQIMNLLLLSPRIQEQILAGDDPKIHKLRERDIRPLFKEAIWSRQETLWRTLHPVAHLEIPRGDFE